MSMSQGSSRIDRLLIIVMTLMAVGLNTIMYHWTGDQIRQPAPRIFSARHVYNPVVKEGPVVSKRDSVQDTLFWPGSTQTERQNIMRNACSHYGDMGIHNISKNNQPRNRILEKYEVLINIIPKCGGTNLCRVLLSLAGIHNSTEGIAAQTVVDECKIYIPNLSNYTTGNVTRILKNFKKVVFVRNPFTRLLSAFRDRLEAYPNRNLGQRRRHNKKIFTMFGNHSKREMPNRSTKSEMYNVTFKSFVSYYLSGHRDIHWTEQYKLVQPCLHYDFIGKLETFDEDLIQLLKFIKADPSRYQFESLNPTNSSEDNILKSYYGTLTNQQMEKLVQLLTPDMKYFGYLIPEPIRREKAHKKISPQSLKHLKIPSRRNSSRAA